MYKGTPALGLSQTPLEVGLLISAGIGLGSGLITCKMSSWLQNKVKNVKDSIPHPTHTPTCVTPTRIEMNVEKNQRNQHIKELQGHVRTLQEDIKNDNLSQLYRHADTYHPHAEKLCSYLQIFTAICDSFSHGANDIANSVGPFAAIYSIWYTGAVMEDYELGYTAYWILTIGGFGISLGLLLYGYKIIRAIGVKMCRISPSKGVAIELGSATTIIMGSRFGIPLSTTHCQIGSTIGVGLLEKTNSPY